MAKSKGPERKGAKASPRGARAVSALARDVIEPALLKRAGLTIALAANWPDLVGPELATRTRPLRIDWGRRPHAGADAPPGTLVVAADGGAALRLQHEADQIVERVNVLHGHRAIGRITVVNSPVEQETPSASTAPQPVPSDPRTSVIADDRLRAALDRLGAGVSAKAAAGKTSSRRDR